MAKHKKTLEQKKKTDHRKHLHPSIENPTGLNTSPTFSLSNYQFSTQPTSTPTLKNSSVSLSHGLEKSIIVSSVIVILQLAIFFLLTHHILILPGNQIQY